MDFRTCPACQASVLEDDVEDCPFCGASMSGKPGGKPKPSASPAGGSTKSAAPKKKPAGKPSGKPTGAASAKAPAPKPEGRGTSSGEGGAEDDPFGVDTSAHTKAIPLTPTATKTRTFLVKCPMCETEGYIRPEDTGKHVRCGNANCMIPVFKVPRVAIEEKPAVAEKKGLSPAIKWGGGGLVVAVVGALVWFFVLREVPEVTVPPANIPITRPTDPVDDPDKVTPPVTPAVKKVTLADVQQNILNGVKSLAPQRRPANRSLEFSRQLSTEILTVGGRIPQAVDELATLKTISARKSPYHQVDPLAELGWQALSTGDTAKAEQYAAEALDIVNKGIPTAVRRTLDAEVRLMALLVALHQGDKVLPMLAQLDAEPRARVSLLWLATTEGGTFDFDVEAQHVWHLEVPAPVSMALVEVLVCRGHFADAKEICGQITDPAVREACLAALVGRAALKDGVNAPEIAAELAAAPTESAKIRMQCALADVQLGKGKRPEAEAALAAAVVLSESLGEPQPAPLPKMVEIYNSSGQPYAGLPQPALAEAKVLALSDIAFLQMRMDQGEAGWTTFQRSMDWARSMAPSPAATQDLLDACDQKSATVKSQLDSLLKLGGNSATIFRAFNQYRRQCDQLDQEAQDRFKLQVRLLKQAALQGQLQQVWKLVQARAKDPNLNVREPYYKSDVPGMLQMEGDVHDKALAGEIRAFSKEQTLVYDRLDWIRTVLPGLTADPQKLDAAAAKLRSELTQPDVQKQPFVMDEVALRVISRVQRKAKTAQMIDFLLLTGDATLKEDAFLLLGGYLGQRGRAVELEKAMSDVNSKLEVTHKLSIQRGLISLKPASAPAEQR
ncbi:MAG: hypothetical protein KDA90_19370 [Planctomycetaceae bacterium]|nr:hypothetical protein [Planctomycetaceae bacterium]